MPTSTGIGGTPSRAASSGATSVAKRPRRAAARCAGEPPDSSCGGLPSNAATSSALPSRRGVSAAPARVASRWPAIRSTARDRLAVAEHEPHPRGLLELDRPCRRRHAGKSGEQVLPHAAGRVGAVESPLRHSQYPPSEPAPTAMAAATVRADAASVVAPSSSRGGRRSIAARMRSAASSTGRPCSRSSIVAGRAPAPPAAGRTCTEPTRFSSITDPSPRSRSPDGTRTVRQS